MNVDLRSTTATALHTTTVDGRLALALHGDDWRALAARVTGATFQVWPEAFDAWLRELASGVTARVILVHEGPALVGVLPVMCAEVRRGPAFVPRLDYAPYDQDLAPRGRRPFPVRQVSSVVSWRAAALRPTLLCAPMYHAAVIELVTAALAAMQDVDLIVLPVRADEATFWLAGLRHAGLSPWCHDLKRQVSTLENLRSFDEIVARQSRNFRKNVNRAREAAATAGLTYAIHDGPDEVAPQLARFAVLAAQSWKATGRQDATAISYAGGQQAFFERISRDGKSGVTPLLVIGTAGGQDVTASLLMRHGAALTGLLTFRNALHPEASPGMMGIAAAIDHAARLGIRSLDLNTTQDWLRHVADSSHMLVNVAAFRPTLRGRAYDAIARARRRLQRDAVT